MKWIIRSIGAAMVLAASVQTAQACNYPLDCTKTATVGGAPVNAIGPSYPVDVTYGINIFGTVPGSCGCITTLTDSLVDQVLEGGSLATFKFDWRGQICWPENISGAEFLNQSYTVHFTWDLCKLVGVEQTDGTYKVKNVVTGSGVATGHSDEFTCEAEITCRPPGEGCTLTPGYWKTHSSYGPAPYDDTWLSVGGADAIFFPAKAGNTATWYQVFWTDSSAGAYYTLARAYMAAVLNGYAGASAPSQVEAALALAENFFTNYGPGDALSKSLRGQVLMWAGVLDDYNNGLLSPAHCAE